MEPRRSNEKRAERLSSENQIDAVANRQVAHHQPKDLDVEAAKIAALRQLRLAARDFVRESARLIAAPRKILEVRERDS